MSEFDTIFEYSRAQAIEDGVLIDVSALRPDLARDAGIGVPVAMASAAWERCVVVPEGVEGQDEAGRLWDVLYLFGFSARRARGESELFFKVRVRNNNQEGDPPLVELKAVIGPGDAGEPVLTIMLPQED